MSEPEVTRKSGRTRKTSNRNRGLDQAYAEEEARKQERKRTFAIDNVFQEYELEDAFLLSDLQGMNREQLRKLMKQHEAALDQLLDAYHYDDNPGYIPTDNNFLLSALDEQHRRVDAIKEAYEKSTKELHEKT